MLKRIQKLENIGRFGAASCGAAEFSKLTLIFGRNSYGKSTLSEILRSLGTDDVQLLMHRKTIPSSSSPQVAKLSFIPNGQTSEVMISAGAYFTGKRTAFHSKVDSVPWEKGQHSMLMMDSHSTARWTAFHGKMDTFTMNSPL